MTANWESRASETEATAAEANTPATLNPAHALALLVTYPARRWLTSAPHPRVSARSAVHYLHTRHSPRHPPRHRSDSHSRLIAAGAIVDDAVTHDALGNIGYVRRLWTAFGSGGVPAMAELIPPDVTWRPIAAEGRALRGTQDLDAFWSSRAYEMPTLRMFHGHGDDVLVEAEYRREDTTVRTVWLLYRFDGHKLLEAIAFPHEAQARSYSPPAGSARH